MTVKTLRVVRTLLELRQTIATWRGAGETIVLVPTMGALHDGHLALVARARAEARRTVVSIFVNPQQFAANEDLERYPRDEAGDVAKLVAAGADLVWAPSVAEMYGPGFATRIEPLGAALELEGAIRPHHFGGVATVCAKLFHQIAPVAAVFGEKDYQQLCVIRQLVRDLDMQVRIVGLATVRESDGLARSSRNRYLTGAERRLAPALFAELSNVATEVEWMQRSANGEIGAGLDRLCATASGRLLARGFQKVDYVAVRDASTLSAVSKFETSAGARVLAAAWLGSTRLIDNVAVRLSPSSET